MLSVKWLRNPEGQLARWLEKLEEYSFLVKHRPSKKHANADSLSRLGEFQVSEPMPVDAVHQQDQPIT